MTHEFLDWLVQATGNQEQVPNATPDYPFEDPWKTDLPPYHIK